MIKKVLLIETTLVSAFIAAFFSIASMSKSNHDTLASNDIQTSVQSGSYASPQHIVYIKWAEFIPSLNNSNNFIKKESELLSYFFVSKDFCLLLCQTVSGSQRWRCISTWPLGLKVMPSDSNNGRWRLQPGAVRPTLFTTR